MLTVEALSYRYRGRPYLCDRRRWYAHHVPRAHLGRRVGLGHPFGHHGLSHGLGHDRPDFLIDVDRRSHGLCRVGDHLCRPYEERIPGDWGIGIDSYVGEDCALVGHHVRCALRARLVRLVRRVHPDHDLYRIAKTQKEEFLPTMIG